MMDFLAVPFGWVLKACYAISNNYVVALLIFSLAMQILLCPFGIIQQRNMVKQAKMRPMEYIIRKKYAGRTDRATQQKMQNEIMELYQKEGYSPLKGCLPMLLQLVIIFPLYQVVIRPLQFIGGIPKAVCANIVTCFENFRNEAGELVYSLPKSAKEVYVSNLLRGMDAGEIDAVLTQVVNDKGETIVSSEQAGEALSHFVNEGGELIDAVIPNVSIFGQNLGEQPFSAFGDFKGLWFLLLIPVINLGLMYLSQFLSKKLNPQPQEQNAAGGAMNSMKIMMWTMPLMTFFFTFTFPAAIGVYWIFRTLLSMLQQFILSKIFKLPKYTEEELRALEKKMKDAKKGQSKRPDIVYNNGEKRPYKSLHHIDDDE
ncbi:MAG: membrane protein insertase YidC [Clostridia bacterium]|nr:membrane protein insertase YidC [Clostridia bacterium]